MRMSLQFLVRMVNFRGLWLKRSEKNEELEEAIFMEAVVDAYNEVEQAMGWYYFLEDRLNFPFTAKCREEKRTNRVKKDQIYQVVGMADTEECGHDMYVLIKEEGSEN